MVIPLFPGITGLKVENAWGRGSRGRVRCTARLSRALTKYESDRLERFLKTAVEGGEIVHECRAEEVEVWHSKLVESLSGRWAPPERRAAMGANGRVRRDSRKLAPDSPRRPDSAA